MQGFEPRPSRNLIRFIYPKARLGRGMGVNATVVATSSVAGPTLAAGIRGRLAVAVRLNVPIGLAALALSRRFCPYGCANTASTGATQ